jgi:hypothetical protein
MLCGGAKNPVAEPAATEANHDVFLRLKKIKFFQGKWRGNRDTNSEEKEERE